MEEQGNAHVSTLAYDRVGVAINLHLIIKQSIWYTIPYKDIRLFIA